MKLNNKEVNLDQREEEEVDSDAATSDDRGEIRCLLRQHRNAKHAAVVEEDTIFIMICIPPLLPSYHSDLPSGLRKCPDYSCRLDVGK